MLPAAWTRRQAFVPLTGKYALDGMDPIATRDVPEWPSLTQSPSHRRRRARSSATISNSLASVRVYWVLGE